MEKVMDYVISFVALGLYLMIESMLKRKSKNMRTFNVAFAIIGVVGLVITEITSFNYLEYFFLMSLVFSVINLYREHKQS